MLFLVAAVAVTSRVLRLGLGPARALSTGWPAAPHLAVRRLARARTAALGLVAATAVAIRRCRGEMRLVKSSSRPAAKAGSEQVSRPSE